MLLDILGTGNGGGGDPPKCADRARFAQIQSQSLI